MKVEIGTNQFNGIIIKGIMKIKINLTLRLGLSLVETHSLGHSLER